MASLRNTVLALAVAAAQVAKAGDSSQKPIVQKHGGSSGNPLNENLAKFIQESLDLWRVPGMAVGVIDGDNIYTEGYGYATLPDVPATADTLWYGASTSKAQAAALLSHLIHSGNYSKLEKGWATPISSIIRDDFVLQDEWATAHITLDDAVSHRTGFGRHDLAMRRVRDGRPVSPGDSVRNLRNFAMAAEPRVKWSYCNFMYITLGHVLQTVTGVWLGEALQTHLWGPLGMTSTYFDTDDALNSDNHFAAGYAWDEEAGDYTTVPYMAVADASAAGAVISNVKDYAKWVKCLLDKSAPFSNETHADIRKPRMLMSSDTDKNIMDVMTYGLGWMRNNIHGKTVFQHSGGMHAYGAEVFWLPEINYGIVAFGNTASSSNSAELDVVYRLIEDKLNIPAKDRIDIRAKSMKVRDGLPTLESATKDLFRDRPEEPLPGSFNTSQLVGRYKNQGWGDVKFTEEEDPKDASKAALIGPRDEASFRHTFILRHITGDYWLVEAAMIGNSPYMKSYYRAQFVAGVDGEPAAMELDTAGEGDGIVIFTKFG